MPQLHFLNFLPYAYKKVSESARFLQCLLNATKIWIAYISFLYLWQYMVSYCNTVALNKRMILKKATLGILSVPYKKNLHVYFCTL